MSAALVTARAHAKINVFLRVLGRLDDGYHDLESLIVPLELHDVVTAAPADTLSLSVTGERAEEVPQGDDNLALRAARALAEAATSGPTAPGAAIAIHKHIPVAAGMGGGSADAAATLRVLNELWSCGLDEGALTRVAALVGSDVPALIARRPVLATGRGERVVRAHVRPAWWAIHPFDFGVRAADAYAWWDREGATGPDPAAALVAAETGDAEGLGMSLFNDLQGPVESRHPEIAGIRRAFVDAGALGAVMTGSGPTVAALAANRAHARDLAKAVPGSSATVGPPPAAVPPPGAG